MTASPIDVLAVALLDSASCIDTIPGSIVAESPIHGRGLFTVRAWSAGEVIATLDGQVVDVTRHPAVIDALEWNALTTELLLVRPIRTSYGYINHSIHPNVDIDDDGRTMRARHDIAAGRELTIDYFAQPVPEAYLTSAEGLLLRASRAPATER
jgi:hypothetical protein